MTTPNIVMVPHRPGTTPTASSTPEPMTDDAKLLEKRRELAASMAAQARWLPKMTLSNYSS